MALNNLVYSILQELRAVKGEHAVLVTRCAAMVCVPAVCYAIYLK